MSTFSVTDTYTFTLTHARHLASKVATDLLRFQRYYGRPTDSMIDDYELELVELLRNNYLGTVTYGFKRDEKWVEALRYRATPGGDLVADDDPGKIRPGRDVTRVPFYSYLTYSNAWQQLSHRQRENFKARLPFQRSHGDEPRVEDGYWSSDLSYSAGGRAIARSTVKRW